MLTTDFLAAEITARYGTVQRARGCFLYTRKGTRLTDLYREGGRAILGWDGGSAFTLFKNVLCRGLTGSFDTDFIKRIDRAVSTLLASDRKIFIYTSRIAAVKAALAFSAESTSAWKPWNQDNIDWRNISSVIIEPPLPWTPSVFITAVKPELCEKDVQIPETERIPAPLAEAVTRAVYNMIAAFQKYEEKDWFIYDTILTKYWTRRGPYLYPKMEEQEYGEFMLHCLDCGIVISPDYNVPSIVPFGADKGVFTALKNAPFGEKNAAK